MTKINIPRFKNVSKLLTTTAGNELREFITYSSNTFEQLLRSLQKGLTFEENFAAQVRIARIFHNTDTQILVPSKPSGVIPLRVTEADSGIDSFNWYINASGNLIVNITFTDTPTDAREVKLLILQ